MYLSNIIDDLYIDFNKCKLSLDDKEGGKMRHQKGCAVVDLIASIIELIIKEKQLSTLKVIKNFKIKKSISVSCDIGVLKNNKLFLNIECKDYCDLSMYKRVCVDAKGLSKIDKNIKTLCIPMQNACTQPIRDAWNEAIFDDQIDCYPDYFSFLETNRISSKNIYILELDREIVLEKAIVLKLKIENFIK